MTIDEAIEKTREKAKEIMENMIIGDNLEPYESYCNSMAAKSAEEYEQIAKWLEDYKRIKMLIPIEQALKNEYNKAIDDFAEKLKSECREHFVDCDPYFGGITDSILYEDDIEEIAEQLKAGGENEKGI